jgi:hypothetical protein
MRSLEMSERERAAVLWERVRGLYEYSDDGGCSEFFAAAADATSAGLAALEAGAFEKASGAFDEALTHFSAGEACLQANAILRKAVPK